MATDKDFELAFELLVGHEGGYTDNPADPGNWTGGGRGKGVLKGTKYGISAASFPALDIKHLTLEQAHEIYHREYWAKCGCPDLPPRLAYVMLDSAVNVGPNRTLKWLQTAVGVAADGGYGTGTKTAVSRALAKDSGGTDLAVEVHAQRLHYMSKLGTWQNFGLGWSRRLARLPLEAAHHWPIIERV